jgi:hypothetical protein
MQSIFENNIDELQPKKRLQEEGVDFELIQLFVGRNMVNPRNPIAAMILECAV